MSMHECLFAWRGTPTVKGEIKEMNKFSQIKKLGLLEFGILMKQMDDLAQSPEDYKDKDYADPETLEADFDNIVDDENDHLLVLISDGKIAGCMSYHIWGNKRKKRMHGYINDVSTLPEYQGTGVATKLIEYAIGRYPKYQWSLYVHDNNPGARAVYERLGFVADLTRMDRKPT